MKATLCSRRAKVRASTFALCCALMALFANSAEAQIGRGDLRLSLDTDMLGVAFVNVDPDTGPDYDATVFSLGPNQLGGSRVWPGAHVASPIGFGLGYALSHRTVLGVRTGLGFDVIDDDRDGKGRVLALTLQPGVTFVPLGNHAKLFINLAALMQVDRYKDDDNRNRLFMGGFSAGLGTLIFVSQRSSVDLGFHFEGRFGNYQVKDPENDRKVQVRDLRIVVRLGFSLWK
jgi:hypothetical protein